MKKFQKSIVLATAMALLCGQVQAQNCETPCAPPCAPCAPCGVAYDECCDSCQMSTWLPIVGVAVVAGVIIAATNRGHHHSHSSRGSNSYSSSSVHSH